MVEALSSLHDPNSMARMQQSLIKHVNEWLVFTYIFRMIYDIHTDCTTYMYTNKKIQCIRKSILKSTTYTYFYIVNVLGQ